MNRSVSDSRKYFPVLALLVLLALVSATAVAQTSGFVGTWKLNVEKSKYEPGPPPKEQSRTWDAAGKVDVQGTDASGKPRQYGYTVNLDGKEYPATGEIPNGADTVVSKRVDQNTIESNFTRAGKHVETARFILSEGGKVMTLTAKGVTPSGVHYNTVARMEKQ